VTYLVKEFLIQYFPPPLMVKWKRGGGGGEWERIRQRFVVDWYE
jgi:hypothetical protein